MAQIIHNSLTYDTKIRLPPNVSQSKVCGVFNTWELLDGCCISFKSLFLHSKAYETSVKDIIMFNVTSKKYAYAGYRAQRTVLTSDSQLRNQHVQKVSIVFLQLMVVYCKFLVAKLFYNSKFSSLSFCPSVKFFFFGET